MSTPARRTVETLAILVGPGVTATLLLVALAAAERAALTLLGGWVRQGSGTPTTPSHRPKPPGHAPPSPPLRTSRNGVARLALPLPHAAAAIALGVLLLVPLTGAQAPPGGAAADPIEGLTITPDQGAEVLLLTPGEEMTISYTLYNQGPSKLNLSVVSGFGGGGFGGGGSGGGGRSPPPEGQPPREGQTSQNGQPPRGPNPSARSPVNTTLLSESNLTLEPEQAASVIYRIQIRPDAEPGEYTSVMVVRESSTGRMSSSATSVRIPEPEPAEDDGGSSATAGSLTPPKAETPAVNSASTAIALAAVAVVARATRRR